MNIVQLHDRVRFWIDTVASTRFESDDIDQAINNAAVEIADEKYSKSRLNHRGDSFQNSQRVRDELSNLVKPLDTDGSLTLTKHSGYVLVSNFPDDYKYLLAIALYVDDDKYNAWPETYDRKNVTKNNPFRRIRSTPTVKCYFLEDETGIKIYHPFDQDIPTKAEIVYLADPVDVFYGYEKTPSDSIGGNVPIICSLTPTGYDGTDYVSGTALTTAPSLWVITHGLAVVDFVNPDINIPLHEELAKRAAANCLLSAKDYEKYKVFKAEVLGI